MNVDNKSGGALVMVMIILVAFSVLGIGLLRLGEANAIEVVHVEQSDQAYWIAEAGMQRVLDRLRTDTDFRSDIADYYKSEASPFISTNSMGDGDWEVNVWSDGSDNNFWILSQGTVMGQKRLLSLVAVLNEFGPHGLVTLNGDSTIQRGASIDGSIYQNGTLTTRGDVSVTGQVLADNYEAFGDQGQPIPEDGEINIAIDTQYFTDTYLSLSPTTSTVSDPLDLNNGIVVIDELKINDAPQVINGPGALVVKHGVTFGNNLTVGDNVTIVVDGDLKIEKDVDFGQNVTLFADEMTLFKNADSVSIGDGALFLATEDMVIKKEMTFTGVLFTEGSLTADKDLNVTGTIITQEGFDLKKDATITFDEGVIPPRMLEGMVSFTYTVSESHWYELPAN